MSLYLTHALLHEVCHHTCLTPRSRAEEDFLRDDSCDALLALSVLASSKVGSMKVGSMIERRHVPWPKRRYGVVPLLIAVADSALSMNGDTPFTTAFDDRRRTDSLRRSPPRELLVQGQTSTIGAEYAAPSRAAMLNCTSLGAMTPASDTPFFRFRRWTKAQLSSLGSTREWLAAEPIVQSKKVNGLAKILGSLDHVSASTIVTNVTCHILNLEMSDTCGFGGLSGVAITALAITFVPSPTLTQKFIASLGPPVSESIHLLPELR